MGRIKSCSFNSIASNLQDDYEDTNCGLNPVEAQTECLVLARTDWPARTVKRTSNKSVQRRTMTGLRGGPVWDLRDVGVHLLAKEASPVVLMAEAGRVLAWEVQWWAEHVCILLLALRLTGDRVDPYLTEKHIRPKPSIPVGVQQGTPLPPVRGTSVNYP
jgi:hypothetical protein